MSEQELKQQIFDLEDKIYNKYKEFEIDNKVIVDIESLNLLELYEKNLKTNEISEKLKKSISEFENNKIEKEKFLNINKDLFLKVKLRKSIYDKIDLSILLFMINENYYCINYAIFIEKSKYFDELKLSLNKYTDYNFLFELNCSTKKEDIKNIKNYFKNNAKYNLKDFILDYEKYEKYFNIEIFDFNSEEKNDSSAFIVFIVKK